MLTPVAVIKDVVYKRMRKLLNVLFYFGMNRNCSFEIVAKLPLEIAVIIICNDLQFTFIMKNNCSFVFMFESYHVHFNLFTTEDLKTEFVDRLCDFYDDFIFSELPLKFNDIDIKKKILNKLRDEILDTDFDDCVAPKYFKDPIFYKVEETFKKVISNEEFSNAIFTMMYDSGALFSTHLCNDHLFAASFSDRTVVV